VRKIYSFAMVDENLCIGDRICENICVTKAISVVDKKAFVNESRCVNCKRCMDACLPQAIPMKQRKEPIILGVNANEVDQNKLKELCARANFDPEEPVCVCTFTTAKEIAASVLKGAKTPEDVTLMTGARSACGMWCMAPILRILNAHYKDIPESDNYRWYNIKSDLWNTSKDVNDKYPEYRLEEDKELFKKGIFHNLLGH